MSSLTDFLPMPFEHAIQTEARAQFNRLSTISNISTTL